MQADLTVHYVNHVHVYIDCSDAIAQELSDFFTFFCTRLSVYAGL